MVQMKRLIKKEEKLKYLLNDGCKVHFSIFKGYCKVLLDMEKGQHKESRTR